MICLSGKKKKKKKQVIKPLKIYEHKQTFITAIFLKVRVYFHKTPWTIKKDQAGDIKCCMLCQLQ